MVQSAKQRIGALLGGREHGRIDVGRPQLTGRGVVGLAQFHDRLRQTHLDERGR
ncbi:hypothetical protein [Streptomyces sp. NPDC003480]